VVLLISVSFHSAADPNSIQLLSELKAASFYVSRAIVEKPGRTTARAEKPSTEMAQACQLALSAPH